ncbi:MAG: LLM class flavin-dependent oxidoreductase [Actinomycetota bacterium]|nr:LLM class flavin-dependent oxidoreductase [Actinomycetota bacterium]
MEIDLQLNPATMPWPVLRAGAAAAEESGFGALWMVDHLAGRSMGGDTMLECFTTLGALAASTRSIALGTLVVNVNNRSPGLLAVAAATLDRIADRATFLGLGAGASPTSPFASEQIAAGHHIEPTLAGRHALVAHQLDVLDLLWSDTDPDRRDFPRPARPPHLLLGVSSTPLARMAGSRTDGVNVRWNNPAAGDLIAAARSARAARDAGHDAGRDDAGALRPFIVTVWARWDPALFDAEHPDRLAMAATGVDRLILLAIDPVTPDEIVAAAAKS